MAAAKVPNRWVVVIGAMLIQLCLGAIYAWSVFTKKITDTGLETAIVHYQKSLELNSDQSNVKLVLADALLTKGELTQAKETYQEVYDEVDDWRALGQNLEVVEKQEPSAGKFLLSVLTFGASVKEDFKLGTMVKDKITEIDNALTAMESNPTYKPQIASVLGYTKENSKDYYTPSINWLQEQLQENPDDAYHHYRLGAFLQQRGGVYGFTAKEAAWVFSAGLFTFAFVMLFAGRWQAKVGPKKVAMVGGAVLGAGYVLGGFLGSTFPMQFLCIGILGGAGIGLAYVVPIAVGVKWFPDKKGLISGLAVAGFGFGATLWVKLAGSWFGGLLNTTNLFGLPGVQSVFIIYGITFLVLVLLGSLTMINPPAGWKPAGWNPKAAKGAGKQAGAGVDLMPNEMRQTPQYWGLVAMFTGSALAGLMVIYCIRLFGIDSLQANGVAETASAAGAIAGTAMAWYAILNGLGRIIWGVLSDKIGRKTALIAMCALQGVMMLIFFQVGGSKAGLIVGACVIGFNFGGNFALFAAACADFFGSKNMGQNYPWVFLAYGVAGIAGPQIAGYFKDTAVSVDAWKTPFLIAGIACLIAAGLAVILKPVAVKAPAKKGKK